MSGLYESGWSPRGTRKDWDRTSMEEFGSGELLRRYGVRSDWGDPVEAVGWFEEDGDGTLRILAANYSNDRSVILRRTKRNRSMTFGQRLGK